jgi:GMP synthase-like glutamine amidotransferase
MRVVVIRHHEIDDAGFIADAFRARGAELTAHLFPADGVLPPLDGVDHVVVLGAEWSVYGEQGAAHRIEQELAWLREADASGVPVLGICFGAQALAAALGGRAQPAARKEIGWTTIESLAQHEIEEGPWLEFHGDLCVLPPGARLLARTEVCAQAFSLGRHLAVQFHPEVDAAQLRRWLAAGSAAEAEAAGLDPDKLVAQTEAEEQNAARRADRLVATALQIAAAPQTPAAAQTPAAVGRNRVVPGLE